MNSIQAREQYNVNQLMMYENAYQKSRGVQQNGFNNQNVNMSMNGSLWNMVGQTLIKKGGDTLFETVKTLLKSASNEGLPGKSAGDLKDANENAAKTTMDDAQTTALITKFEQQMRDLGVSEENIAKLVADIKSSADDVAQKLDQAKSQVQQNNDEIVQSQDNIQKDQEELKSLYQGDQLLITDFSNLSFFKPLQTESSSQISGIGSASGNKKQRKNKSKSIPAIDNMGQDKKEHELLHSIETNQNKIKAKTTENQALSSQMFKNVDRGKKAMDDSKNAEKTLTDQKSKIQTTASDVDAQHSKKQGDITQTQTSSTQNLVDGTSDAAQATVSTGKGATETTVGTVAESNPYTAPVGAKLVTKGAKDTGIGASSLPPSGTTIGLEGRNTVKAFINFTKNIAGWGVEMAENVAIAAMNGSTLDSNAVVGSLLQTTVSSGIDAVGMAITGTEKGDKDKKEKE